MSHNLELWEPGGTSFTLRQTPTDVTERVLACSGTGEKVVRYIEWLERYEALGDAAQHVADLIDWLLAHPDHSWVST